MDPQDRAAMLELMARVEELLQQIRDVKALVTAQGQQLLAARSQ